MRRITDFMVKYCYVFLITFILLSGISLYLATKVNINEDIMEYLPKTSETKIGKDIMDDNFPEMDTSILNVMFKNLSKSEKKRTLSKLKKIKGVSSVEYDSTNKYNHGKYTLYILNVDDYARSKTSKHVYDYVKNDLKPAAMSGSINDEYKPILQLWIVAVAITGAMIILILLSESYIEPFLYLISIGIAVFINKGTNIIFPSVSSITNSIVAILQLALSMDYSIMLSNRFKQEKMRHKSKVNAMKEALYHSFSAISSSSVTTIVGLLALVFMSFTIGKDLGFVLAKGVLLSLVSIFCCLPALLLLCDDLIAKTHKKSFSPNLDKLGKYSYITRYIQPVLIVLLFIVTYLLKGNIKVLYTGHQQDVVGKHFPATNQIAIVYDNKYEDLVGKYCHELESDKKIDQVLCYSNTIGEDLEYNKLNKKLKDLGQSTKIDDELIKIIYYNYYTKNKTTKITLDEFITFIKTNIYSNDTLNKKIDKDTRDNLDLLSKFTNNEEINKKRSISELSNILGINNSDAEKILILYNSKNINTSMTIKDFVNFLLNYVAQDREYASNLDNNTLSKLKRLQKFTDINNINRKMNADELSNIFGIDKNLINQLLLFYKTTTESSTRLSLNEFANFSLNLSNQDTYKNYFDDNKKKSLSLLKSLSDDNVINKKLNMNEMKSSISDLGININDDVLKLLYIYYSGSNTNTNINLNTFASVALNMASDNTYKNYFTSDSIESLKMIQNLNSYYDKELSNNNLYQMFNINSELGNKLNYVITGNPSGTYTMTPVNFVNTLLNNNDIASNLDNNTKASLQKALYIMNNVNTTYSKEELVKVLSQNNMTVNIVYGVYDYQNNRISSISVKELINFIYNNKNNPIFSKYLSNMGSMLDLAYKIVNNTNTLYNYIEISSITNTDKELVKKIYGIYDYNKYGASLTPMELVNLIISNKDNSLLKGKISNDSISTLSLVNEVMISTINNTKYSSYNLSNLLGIDKSKLDLLYSLYDYKYNKTNNTISLYNYVNFIISDVMNNQEYGKNIDKSKKDKLLAISSIMKNSLIKTKYSAGETFTALSTLSNKLNKDLIELVYIYYGSNNLYDNKWMMTIEEFINYLNDDIIKDPRFEDFISSDKRTTIVDAKKTIDKSKKLIVSKKYSRAVLNTKYSYEDKDAYDFVNKIKNRVGDKKGIYVVGNSPMAVEMSKTFNGELNRITILTMLFIFLVVAVTFKDLIIPFILVLIIQTAVYITMSFISITGGSVYFISVLIVQAILMGATIDYAIVYTSYYLESRSKLDVKESLINAYNKSIHTILSSSSILIIVTLVVANFASAIAAKICETISQGTLASTILILFALPGTLAACDKLIVRKRV